MSRRARAVTAAAAVVALLLGLVYGVLLVPGVRPDGYDARIDVWLNQLSDAAVIVVVLLRAVVSRRDRAAWLLMVAGLGSAFAASISYFTYFQHQDPIPSPSAADAGWLGFYLLLCAGLVLLLRARVRHMLRSVWLDGLIGGLTVAAVADQFIEGASVPGASAAGFDVLYPLADLLLLSICGAALAVLGRQAGRTWVLLCLSFATFAAADVHYAQQVAAGTYTPGDPVDAGWLVARLLLAAAACCSLISQERRRDVEGLEVLLIPGVCAVAVLLLLAYGNDDGLRPSALALALTAGLVMVLRTAFTFRELRTLTAARRQALMERLVEAQDEERARIAADVHDDSLQALAAVDLRLGALRRRLPPDEATAVTTTMEAVHEAAVRLRHLLFELEAPALEADLADALEDAAAHLFDDTGVRWSVRQRGPRDLPQAVRVSAYRIAREAMVNALKHAQATRVDVTVAVSSRGVTVHVVDDGLGVERTQAPDSGRRHSGMSGMRDRAMAAAGWWRCDPGPQGRGTDVAFFLPAVAPGLQEQPSYDARRPGHGDDQLPLHAPAEQDGEVLRDRALQ